MDNAQRCGERGHLPMRRVTVPFEVGPLPEETPYQPAANILQLGNSCLYLLSGPSVGRPNIKKLDVVPGEPLAFTNLVAHAQRRTMMGPKKFFDGSGMLGDFFVGKGHGLSAVRFYTKKGPPPRTHPKAMLHHGVERGTILVDLEDLIEASRGR